MSLLVFSGCGKSEPTFTKTDSTAKSGETVTEKCRKKLAGAMRRLDPQELVTQANPERSINGVNAWLASCAADEISALHLDEAALKILENNVRATSTRFTVNDSTYIRDCLLLRDLTASILETALSDDNNVAGQDGLLVKKVFEWVVRNISLVDKDPKRPPLGLFDVMLTGQGRPEDRAWVFAEALRQQQIDVVVVKPATEASEGDDQLATAEWLVAVLLEDKSLIYDMEAGLPIVADDGRDLLNLSVIGLKQLRDHARWQHSSVQIVAQIAAFAPRMLVLQQQLAVEDSAILFEELTGGVSEIRPILSRVSEASGGLWAAEAVSIWPYPEMRAVAAQSLTEEQRGVHRQLMRPFDAPFERSTFATESTEELTTVPEELSKDERQALIQQRLMKNFEKMMGSSEEMFGKPSKRLLKTRVRQILGADDTGVIQQLQQIRIASMESVVTIQVPIEVQKEYGFPAVMGIPFPQMIREVNLSSTGAALYWSALRQIELGEVGAAITTLLNYRRQYPRGQWTYPSMINQAMAFLAQARTGDAVEILKAADVEENPERVRAQQMLKILSP